MSLFDLNNLHREVERTLEQRRTGYPRAVAAGGMTDRMAELRLDQTEAVGDALWALMCRHPDTAVAVQSEVAEKQAARVQARRTGRRS